MITLFLWLLLLLVLAGSFTHTEWLFALREPLWPAMAWILALGVDAGIAGATAAIRMRRQQQRPAGLLRFVLWICVAISIYANLAHAVAADVGGELALRSLAQLDPIHMVTSFLVSVPLPLLVLAIADTVSDDAATAQQEQESAQRKEETARKRAAARAQAEALRANVAQIAQALNIDRAKARRVVRAQTLLSADPAPSMREVAQAVGLPDSTLRGYLGRLEKAAQEEQ